MFVQIFLKMLDFNEEHKLEFFLLSAADGAHQKQAEPNWKKQ